MIKEFVAFPKLARLVRECFITEKIDGTNAQIRITDNGDFLVGSRTRWITPDDDNYGFAKWAFSNKEELMTLGPGSHFGEWWGAGIQRKYGMPEKKFSLFNAAKWVDKRPACCDVVPILYQGLFSDAAVNLSLLSLIDHGSKAAPGFMNPEGIVVFHSAAGVMFKQTIENDNLPKSLSKETLKDFT